MDTVLCEDNNEWKQLVAEVNDDFLALVTTQTVLSIDDDGFGLMML
jgi:hypothetical protein